MEGELRRTCVKVRRRKIMQPLSYLPDTRSFLQFGSPHGLSSQAQYVSAERSEVWVNIGYRLSAFGFAACDEPLIKGNFGFKDQWMALEWVKENIASFGGGYCR